MSILTHSTPMPLSSLSELAQCIDERAVGPGPFLLAVAGPPGSGKSTIAAELQRHITRASCVVPMDGFHLDNATLVEMEMLQRKGAPETFDLIGFSTLVDTLRTGATRHFPTFDRTSDSVVPNGGSVPKETEVIIFEGNYLLFNEPGWTELSDKWDASVWLDVPPLVLEERLTRRWLDHGLSNDAAKARANLNDLPNAARISAKALPATWVFSDASLAG